MRALALPIARYGAQYLITCRVVALAEGRAILQQRRAPADLASLAMRVSIAVLGGSLQATATSQGRALEAASVV